MKHNSISLTPLFTRYSMTNHTCCRGTMEMILIGGTQIANHRTVKQPTACIKKKNKLMKGTLFSCSTPPYKLSDIMQCFSKIVTKFCFLNRYMPNMCTSYALIIGHILCNKSSILIKIIMPKKWQHSMRNNVLNQKVKHTHTKSTII